MARQARRIKIRDKQRTKQKLINAVGKILCKEGYTAIRINKIAEVAKVNKKLIYDYFKGLDGLTKAYLEQVDFWSLEKSKALGNPPIVDLSKDKVFSILKNDFEYFQNSVEMQKIIVWSLSEKNKSIRALQDSREEYGRELFQISDKIFQGSGIDFRAVNAIFVSAIYYMVLHVKSNGGNICEIDVLTSEGRDRIFKTINQILEWCYNATNKPSG